MSEKLIETPLSKAIAREIAQQMQKQHIGASRLERMLEGEVNMYAIRRVRKGSSGCQLRTYEKILDALDLTVIVMPKKHRDIL